VRYRLPMCYGFIAGSNPYIAHHFPQVIMKGLQGEMGSDNAPSVPPNRKD